MLYEKVFIGEEEALVVNHCTFDIMYPYEDSKFNENLLSTLQHIVSELTVQVSMLGVHLGIPLILQI